MYDSGYVDWLSVEFITRSWNCQIVTSNC